MMRKLKHTNKYFIYPLILLGIVGCVLFYYFFIMDSFDKKLISCAGMDQKLNIVGAEFGCKMNVARELSKSDPNRALKICLESSPINDGSYYGKAVSTGFCKSELTIL